MRVLFVVNWFTPKSKKTYGAGVFHYEQCIDIQKHHSIRLYWPFDEEVKGLEYGEENGLFIYRSEWNRSKSKISWYSSAKKYLLKICREYKPNIIHANVAYPTGLLCVEVAKRINIPVVHTEHAPIEQMYLNNLIRKKMRGYVYKKCKRNICVSKDSMNRLHRIYPNIDFQIVYNAVIDPQSIENDGNVYRKEGKVNACIVAAFYDEFVKGYQYLLPAIKECNATGECIHLHICGGGEYESQYIRLSEKLEIQNDVTFYGQCNRKKVYSIVRQMDFCVSSSVYECSGVSVQEEQLLGKPILVTKSGGANSLCTNETSIEVDRESVTALVEGLHDMVCRYNQFDSSYIRKYAFENFEISHITQKYIEIYQDVYEETRHE